MAAAMLCVSVVEAQTPATAERPPGAGARLSRPVGAVQDLAQPMAAAVRRLPRLQDDRAPDHQRAHGQGDDAARRLAADLRWLLDTFLMSQQGAWEEYETPRFFLLQNGSVTASTAGNNGWRDYMWPTILDVTNTKP